MFGPALPLEQIRAMGGDYATYVAYLVKYLDYYWSIDPLRSSMEKWYGSPLTHRFVNGGQGGGNYYGRDLIYYVLWAVTGEQKYLDRAIAMTNDQKRYFNAQSAFSLATTPGGAEITLGGSPSGTTTMTSKYGSETLHAYDVSGNYVTWYENLLQDGDAVTFAAGMTLPTPLVAGTTYYVKNVIKGNWGASGGVIHWLFRGVYCHWLVTGDPTDKVCLGHFASSALSSYYRNDLIGTGGVMNTGVTSLYLGGGSDGAGHNGMDQRTVARYLDALLYAHLMQADPVQAKTDYNVSPGVSIWATELRAALTSVLNAQDSAGRWAFIWTHGNQVNAGYAKPFMDGLLCESLIQYYNLFEADSRIPAKVKSNCDCIWDKCFVTPATYPTSALGVTSQVQFYTGGTETNVFRYLEGESVFEPTSPDGLGTNTAPNLNLMSYTPFTWYYYISGDSLYKDRADKIFAGAMTYGVGSFTAPQNNSQKSMNELYAFSLRGLFYRAYSLVTGTDTTPSPFTFTDITNATLSTVYTSNTITVSGINSAAAISITGGTYSVNGGSYVSTSGNVNVGDTVSVRVTSSGSNSTGVSATLTIGGVSDTYTVTTQAAGVSSLTYTATSAAVYANPAFSSSNPYTVAAQAIGTAAANRTVILQFLVNTSGETITGITIGGVLATIHVVTPSGYRTGIASAVVPTGTTADIVISTSGGVNSIGEVMVKCGTVYGANGVTPVSTTGVAAFSYSQASVGPLTVPTGGVGVVILEANWNTATITGVVTDEDKDNITNGALCAVFGHATSTFTATAANDAANGTAMVAAVFQI